MPHVIMAGSSSSAAAAVAKSNSLNEAVSIDITAERGEVVDKTHATSSEMASDDSVGGMGGNHNAPGAVKAIDVPRDYLEASIGKRNAGMESQGGEASSAIQQEGKGKLTTANKGQDEEGNATRIGIKNSQQVAPPLKNEGGDITKKRKLPFSEELPKSTSSSQSPAKVGSAKSTATSPKSSSAATSTSPRRKFSPTTKVTAGIDIYGRKPGKEPKYLIKCPVESCDRRLFSSDLALHLEKCMGIQPIIPPKRRSGSTVAAAGGGAAASSSSTSKGVAAGSKGGGKAKRRNSKK